MPKSLQEVTADPEFAKLALEDQKAVAAHIDPEFAKLSVPDQDAVLMRLSTPVANGATTPAPVRSFGARSSQPASGDFNERNRSAGLDPSKVSYDQSLGSEFVSEVGKSARTFGARVKEGINTGVIPTVVAGYANQRPVPTYTEKDRLDFITRARAMTDGRRKAAGIAPYDLIDPSEETMLKSKGVDFAERARDFRSGQDTLRETAAAAAEPNIDKNSGMASTVGGFTGALAGDLPLYLAQPEIGGAAAARWGATVAERLGPLAGRVVAYLAKNAINAPVDVVFGEIDAAIKSGKLSLNDAGRNLATAFVARNVLGLLHARKTKGVKAEAATPKVAPAASDHTSIARVITEGDEFTAENLRRTFNLSHEESAATEALADAMGLDKSKIKLSSGPPSTGGLLQTGDNERWYTDNIETALGSWQSKGTPDQLLAHLKKSKGAMDEANAIELRGWLESKPSVTRDEVKQFVGQNRIEVVDVQPPPSAVYDKYTVQGGENYRELLLTLPERDGAPFKQQHFPDQPNVLAHVRLKDRILPDGRKVLFVEEVQSDWHQQGRRNGYFDPKRPWEAVKSGDAPSPEMREQAHAVGLDVDRDVTASGAYATAEEAQAAAGAGGTARHASDGGRAPDAPFKGEGWKKLAIKRVLALAAEKDYDAVAWSTGITHAVRYGQGGHAFGGSWDVPREGIRTVTLNTLGSDPVRFGITAEGEIVRWEGTENQFRSVEEVLPRELVDRIRSSSGMGTFSDDFEFGLGGMQGFYDKELPNIANDLLKPHGVKTKRGQMGKTFDVFDARDNDLVARGVSEAEAQRIAENYGPEADYEESASAFDDEAHIVDVSPQMREAIRSKKQPLFQRTKGAADFVDGGRAVIHALASPDVSTAVHELAHVGRRFLFDRSLSAEQRMGVTDTDIATAEAWAGVTNGVWHREAEERFARGFERYLLDGHAPTPALQGLFTRFKEWLSHIYTRVTGSDVDIKISPQMREVFDRFVQRGDAGSEAALLKENGVGGTADTLTPSQRVVTALKEMGPRRAEQDRIYTAERAERLRKSIAAGENLSGEAGYNAERAALRGEMTKVDFESLRDTIKQDDVDALFNQVRASEKLNDWEKVRAREGLGKLFGEYGGTVPQTNELALLRSVFGDEFVDEVASKQDAFTRAKALGIDLINVPRSVMASLDLSAPFRQGLVLGVANPKRGAAAFGAMFKYALSEEAYRGLDDAIRARPTYGLMQDAGLAINGIKWEREERFASSFAEKIPGVRASGRAYTGFLTKLRADVFDDMVQRAQSLGMKPEDGGKLPKDIASFVNAASGRGEVGDIPFVGKMLEPAKDLLNAMFFSPRLMASRISLMNPAYYYRLDPFVRKEAVKAMLTFLGLGSGVASLAALGGASVQKDPRSADFGKIRIRNTRIDPWGGFQQYARMTAQLASGQYISTTSPNSQPKNLGEKRGSITRYDIAMRQIESKEAPIASFVTDMLRQTDYRGEPVSVTKEIVDRFTPMVVNDIYEVWREDPQLVPFAALSGFGLGVQTYGRGVKDRNIFMDAAGGVRDALKNKAPAQTPTDPLAAFDAAAKP